MTVAAYLPGLSGPLFFDDLPWLSANTSLNIEGGAFEDWRIAALSSTAGPAGRPVTMLSFALNYVIVDGTSATFLKATNLLIHLITGYLVFMLAGSVAKRLWPDAHERQVALFALVTSAIWLLHPLHVSTVLYAIQRMAQMSTLFVVLGLVVFMHYRQKWSLTGVDAGDIVAASMWIGLCALAAVYSKENGVVIVWLILLIEVFLFRGQWAGVVLPPLRNICRVFAVLPGLALLLLVLMSPEWLENMYTTREFSLEQRLMTQSRILWHYLGWLVVPNIFDMGFQHDDIIVSRSLLDPFTTFLSIAAWLLVSVVAFALRGRCPLIPFCLLFYLVGHSVESTVIPLEMVYEHRNYLPAIAVAMAMAALVFLVPSRRWSVIGGMMAGVAVVVLLWIRVSIWSDELRLNASNSANHPQSSRSHYFHADSMLRRYRESFRRGDPEEHSKDLLLVSRYHFEQMYRLNPRDMAAIVMLFYLDSVYFPVLNEREQWLLKLRELVSDRVLQASDFNAIASLVECHVDGACLSSTDELMMIVDELRERYPRSLDILSYKFSLAEHTGAMDSELEAIVDEALAISPGNRNFLYQKILLDSRSGDVAGMYESARVWLYHDRSRVSLTRLDSLFAK